MPWYARLFWLGVLVALIAAVSFLPVLGNGWVDRDDTQNFLDNPSYRGLGLAQLRWAFSSFQLGVYQPVAWILLGAQYEVCGLLPWGYHLASLVMHCANAVVLMALAAAVLSRSRIADATAMMGERSRNLGAASAAILFAAHPLRVEVVAWVSCQPYLPCALFAMLATLAYLKREGASPSGRSWWLAASWCLYVLAMCCKAAAITLPVSLLALDIWPLRRFSGARRSWRASVLEALLEKLPFVAVGLLFFAVALGGKYVSNPAMVSEDTLGVVQRLARAFYSAGFYVEKTFWPSRLSAIYDWPEPVSLFAPWFGSLVFGTAAVTVIITVLGRRWTGAFAAWFGYLALLVPVSGLVRSGFAVVADRYAYLATIPLFIGSAYVLAVLSAAVGGRRRVATALRIVVLAATLGLGALSWRLSRTWRDTDTLIARAHAADTLAPPTYLVELGKCHELRHEFDQAESFYRQAVEVAPDQAPIANTLGTYLTKRGKAAEGMAWFERSVQIDPLFVVGHNNLGLALATRGRVAEAQVHFETALKIHPYYLEARVNLASLFRHQGRLAEAAEHYDWVLKRDPDNQRARSGLAATVAEFNRPTTP